MSRQLLMDLCQALGIERVNRLVLEVGVDRPLRCYAVTHPAPDAYSAVVRFVSDATVSDRGEVTTAPLPLDDTARMLASAVLAGDVEAARALADEVVAQCGGK